MINARLRKFISYYRPYSKLFFADMGCAIIVSLTTLAIPLCIRFVTKSLEENHSDLVTKILIAAGLMIVLVIIHALSHSFIDYQGHVMGALMEKDMRAELFSHYQGLSFKFFDNNKTAQLMTRISNDTFNLSELFHHGPEDIVISALNFLGAFCVLISINAKLALVALLFMPIMGLYGFYFSRKMYASLKGSRDCIGDINAQIEDSLSGIRVVQSFTNENLERKKFDYENNRFVESRKSAYKNEALFYNGLKTLTQLMTVSVVIFGAFCIYKTSLDLSDLITFLLYIVILIEPIQRLGNFIRLYQEGISGFHRFMEALETKSDIQESAEAVSLDKALGSIEFKDISFKYHDQYDHVLKNISFKVEPGEFIAIVGPSGAGKTTLCSLIPRFYEVSSGELLIDGYNIKDLTLESLRKNIGLVQQDVYLFAGTVAENICYGNVRATHQEMINAAKLANAHDFILRLPQGYDTDIGQRGVKLSGGQKQRLSLARVFLKNPPIIIFDEATSALDNASERAVQDAIEKLIQHRTTIVIAHRLSTIKKAKRILVLTDEGIQQTGTHEDLMASNGIYADLYKMHLRVEDQTPEIDKA